MKATIKRDDVIGFTRAPDGAHFLNLKNFTQVQVSAAEWQKMRKEKLQ